MPASTPSAEQRRVAPPPQNLHHSNIYRQPPPSNNSAIPPRKQDKPRKHKLPIRRRRLPKDQQLYWRLYEMHRRFTKQKNRISNQDLRVHKHRHDKHGSHYQFDRNDSAQWNSIIRNLSTVRHRPYPHRSLGRHHPDLSPRHNITRQRNPFPLHLGHYRRAPHSQRLAVDDHTTESSNVFPHTLIRPPTGSRRSTVTSDTPAEPQGAERTETITRSEMHTVNQTQTETQPGEENMGPTRKQGPPPRSPERYAEWGIGPVKHP